MNSLQSFHVEVQYNTKFQCGDCHSTTLENISISYNMNAKKKMSIYHLLKRKMSARFQMLGVRAKNTLGIKLMSCILASVILQNGLNMISSKLCKWIQQTSLSVVLASWEKSKYRFHCYCSTKTYSLPFEALWMHSFDDIGMYDLFCWRSKSYTEKLKYKQVFIKNLRTGRLK